MHGKLCWKVDDGGFLYSNGVMWGFCEGMNNDSRAAGSRHTGIAKIILLCTVAATVLTGCSVMQMFRTEERKQLPVPLEITLSAVERVNPTKDGRPSPIVVRLFELSNNAVFQSADFFALMDQEGASLGNDMLNSEEYILIPGEVRVVRKRAAPNSRFLGVVAGYRDLSSTNWRAVTPLPAPHLAGRFWSRSVSPTKRLYVVMGEGGIMVHEPSK